METNCAALSLVTEVCTRWEQVARGCYAGVEPTTSRSRLRRPIPFAITSPLERITNGLKFIINQRRDRKLREHLILWVLLRTRDQQHAEAIQRCPWIGFIHGFDWIGSDDCYVRTYDGLRFSAMKDVAHLHCCFFYLSVLTNIDYLHCRGFISYQHAALTAQMKSNSETYLMMFSPTEWALDWIGLDLEKWTYGHLWGHFMVVKNIESGLKATVITHH